MVDLKVQLLLTIFNTSRNNHLNILGNWVKANFVHYYYFFFYYCSVQYKSSFWVPFLYKTCTFIANGVLP